MKTIDITQIRAFYIDCEDAAPIDYCYDVFEMLARHYHITRATEWGIEAIVVTADGGLRWELL